MGTMYNDVFMGTADKYNQKLEMLARMAQPEACTAILLSQYRNR